MASAFMHSKFPRCLYAVAGLSCAWLSASAQFDDAAWRADVFYASSYLARGVERAGASLQTAIELENEQFRAGVWANRPFRSNETKEVNLSASRRWELESVALEVSAAHAWFDSVPGGGVDRSLELGLSATLAPIAEFAPTLSYTRDFRFEADTVQAGFARSIALTRWGTFLDIHLSAGWTAGRDWRPDGGGAPQEDGYGFYGAEMRIPYRLGRFTTVVGGIHYTETWQRSPANGAFGGDSRSNLWVTLGVSLDF